MSEQPLSELDKEEYNKLLRNAGIFLRRGDFTSAESIAREAIERCPSGADAQELLGDILLEQGKRSEAAATYKQAVELNPQSVSAETKYAKTVLHLSEEARSASLSAGSQTLLDSSVRKNSPVAAMCASLLWPGLGQVYNGEKTKGAILAGVYAFVLLVLVLTGQPYSILRSLISPGKSAATVSVFASFLWGGAFSAWLYSVVDAPIRAGKVKRAQSPDASIPDL